MPDHEDTYGLEPEPPPQWSPYAQPTHPPPGYAMPPTGPAEKDRAYNYALAGMIMGIVSIPAACIAICGLVVGIPGLFLSIMGRDSASGRNLAMTGIICSIIGLVLAIANAILGVVLAATGNYPGISP